MPAVTPEDETEWALLTQVAELRSENMMLRKQLGAALALVSYYETETQPDLGDEPWFVNPESDTET